jgi:hypothetical protein
LPAKFFSNYFSMLCFATNWTLGTLFALLIFEDLVRLPLSGCI